MKLLSFVTLSIFGILIVGCKKRNFGDQNQISQNLTTATKAYAFAPINAGVLGQEFDGCGQNQLRCDFPGGVIARQGFGKLVAEVELGLVEVQLGSELNENYSALFSTVPSARKGMSDVLNAVEAAVASPDTKVTGDMLAQLIQLQIHKQRRAELWKKNSGGGNPPPQDNDKGGSGDKTCETVVMGVFSTSGIGPLKKRKLWWAVASQKTDVDGEGVGFDNATAAARQGAEDFLGQLPNGKNNVPMQISWLGYKSAPGKCLHSETWRLDMTEYQAFQSQPIKTWMLESPVTKPGQVEKDGKVYKWKGFVSKLETVAEFALDNVP